jgi:hypothetical protein
VFSKLDSFSVPTERIANEALKRYADMQMMKKSEQLFENVKDFVEL